MSRAVHVFPASLLSAALLLPVQAASPDLELRTALAVAVEQLSFSSDGRRLLVWGEEPEPVVYETASGRRVGVHGSDTRPLKLQVFTPSADRLAQVLADGGLELSDLRNAGDPVRLSGHAGEITALAFGKNGAWLASGDTTGAIRVRDGTTGEPRQELGAGAGIEALAFDAEASRLAAACADGSVRLWSTSGWRLEATIEAHDGATTAVTFAPGGRLLLSAGIDGAVRVFDRSGTLRLTLVSAMRGDDWLAVAPDGRFDGSAAGTRRLAVWRSGRARVAPAGLRSEFLRPGLLAATLSGADASASDPLAPGALYPPEIELTLVDRLESDGVPVARLRLEVRQGGVRPSTPGGVRDLRLHSDGALAREWTGTVLSGAKEKLFIDAEVPLVEGGQTITAHAFNAAGVRSATATLTLGTVTPRPGTARVVAVGINAYANATFNLAHAADSASRIADGLAARLGASPQLAAADSVKLLNRQATREAILAAWAKAASDAGPDDALVFYFNGLAVATSRGASFLPFDIGYEGSRGALDEDGVERLAAAGLSDADLAGVLRSTRARWIVLLLDVVETGRGPPRVLDHPAPARLAEETGAWVLVGVQGHGAALAAHRDRASLVAWLLLESLDSGDADGPLRNGLVELEEWLTYTASSVPALQRDAIYAARRAGRELAFVDGEESLHDLDARRLQRPRVYRPGDPGRAWALVVARPLADQQATD